MNKVIPPGLNYSDIIPEAIFSQVKINKFLPARTGIYQGGDVVRIIAQGPGFYDPYSAYLQFDVTVTPSAGSQGALGNLPNVGPVLDGLFIDDSAHSFISRFVLRSQGVELERIEQYDVIAKMINDILYSEEEKKFHFFEGFGWARNQTPNQNSIFTAANPFQVSVRSSLSMYNNKYIEQVSNGDVFMGYAPWDNNPTLKIDAVGSLNTDVPGGVNVLYDQQDTLTFCIPLYSGLIGVLMPVKKFIPLSQLPLEIEITINPHAMYTSCQQLTTRSFSISNIQLKAHVMTFEQELHRSMDAIIAEHGLFINFKTFQQATGVTNQGAAGTSIQQVTQLNTSAKAINSIHFVFLYNNFTANAYVKKLNFQSHRLTSLQLKNGLEYIPSEPITGNAGNCLTNAHVPFLIEMYKAWGKMHDPLSDTGIHPKRYSIDYSQKPHIGAAGIVTTQTAPYWASFFNTFGQCQYGISLEGEQLGLDNTVLTGKKAQQPFEIIVNGVKNEADTSTMIVFYRSDKVVYVRPDLVIQKLGD